MKPYELTITEAMQFPIGKPEKVARAAQKKLLKYIASRFFVQNLHETDEWQSLLKDFEAKC